MDIPSIASPSYPDSIQVQVQERQQPSTGTRARSLYILKEPSILPEEFLRQSPKTPIPLSSKTS